MNLCEAQIPPTSTVPSHSFPGVLKLSNYHPEAVTIRRRSSYRRLSFRCYLQRWPYAGKTISGWLSRWMCLPHLSSMWVDVEIRWKTRSSKQNEEWTANGVSKFRRSPAQHWECAESGNDTDSAINETTAPEKNIRRGWQSAPIPLAWTQQNNPQSTKTVMREHTIHRQTFVTPARFERAAYSLEGCCSIQLSYGVFKTAWKQAFSFAHLRDRSESGWHRLLFGNFYVLLPSIRFFSSYTTVTLRTEYKPPNNKSQQLMSRNTTTHH